MATQFTLRVVAHLCFTSTFLSLAFDPLGVRYGVVGAHLVRRAGTLGGDTPAITETGDSERPYEVDGNTFTDYDSAAQRSCNIQFDNCQLIANTDSSASFSLEDCQSQQDDCIADPPAVADGSSSMNADSVESSDATGTDADEPETSSGSTDTNAGSSTDSASADSNTADAAGSDTGDSDGSESYAATVAVSNAAGPDTEDSGDSESNTATVAVSSTAGPEGAKIEEASNTENSNAASIDAADSSATDAAGSDTSGSDAAASTEADKTEAGSTESDATEADPVLVSQTTIPYDSEFDLVCDL
ncbi:hypothetical protein BDW74DRAFT_151090 [Aspergillus multicolor]|uniref:uncharacterized protein n=1 Tax=Aspergillus multicolor TaxID=41759 RepID=UPI003CCDF44B